MSLGRKIVLCATLLTTTACASVQETKPAKTMSTIPPSFGLQAQELANGECGIFLWTKSQPHTFVFFQKQGENNARYFTQDTEIKLQTVQNMASFDDVEGLMVDYAAPGYETFNIKGTFNEILEGGRRISNATIKTKKPDAWEEIQPVSGVYVCR